MVVSILVASGPPSPDSLAVIWPMGVGSITEVDGVPLDQAPDRAVVRVGRSAFGGQEPDPASGDARIIDALQAHAGVDSASRVT